MHQMDQISGAAEGPALRILAAGMADGERVRLIEHADGSCGIIVGEQTDREIYHCGPGHVEECAHNFLRLLRMPIH